MSGAPGELKAGEYRFDSRDDAAPGDCPPGAGDVYLRPITFPEGLTIGEMAQIFESRGFGPAAAFIAGGVGRGAREAASIPTHAISKGYLFPDTYGCPGTPRPRNWSRQMVGRFKQVFADDLPAAAARTD